MDQFVEAFRGLDAEVQHQFMDRFLKFKSLKRVMPQSKQAFLRDSQGYFGDHGEAMIPLLEQFYEGTSYDDLDTAIKSQAPAEDTSAEANADEEGTKVAEVEEPSKIAEPAQMPLEEHAAGDQPAEEQESVLNAEPEQSMLDDQSGQQVEPMQENMEASAMAESAPAPEVTESSEMADQVEAAEAAPAEQPKAEQTQAPTVAAAGDDTAAVYGGEPRVPVVQEEGVPAGYILPQNRSYNVWIGDLDAEATEEETVEAFRNLGLSIVRARLFKDHAGKNKGWGFAHFADKETMSRVLQTSFAAPLLRGRRIKVGPAQEKNIIFVGNLSFDVTWVEFFNAVIDAIGVDKVQAFELKVKDDGKCRGYGFITCVDQSAAEEGRRVLMSKPLRLHGREATVSWAEKEDENREIKTMYLANLGEDITEEVVRDACVKYGDLLKIVIAKDVATGKAKGYAFVEFQRRLDCLKAIQACNNTIIGNKYAQASMVKHKGNRFGGGFPGGPQGGFGGVGGGQYFNSPQGGRGRGRSQWGGQPQQQGWGGQQWNQGGYGQQQPQQQWGGYAGGFAGNQSYPQQWSGQQQGQQWGAQQQGFQPQGGYSSGFAQRPQGQNARFTPY